MGPFWNWEASSLTGTLNGGRSCEMKEKGQTDLRKEAAMGGEHRVLASFQAWLQSLLEA